MISSSSSDFDPEKVIYNSDSESDDSTPEHALEPDMGFEIPVALPLPFSEDTCSENENKENTTMEEVAFDFNLTKKNSDINSLHVPVVSKSKVQKLKVSKRKVSKEKKSITKSQRPRRRMAKQALKQTDVINDEIKYNFSVILPVSTNTYAMFVQNIQDQEICDISVEVAVKCQAVKHKSWTVHLEKRCWVEYKLKRSMKNTTKAIFICAVRILLPTKQWIAIVWIPGVGPYVVTSLSMIIPPTEYKKCSNKEWQQVEPSLVDATLCSFVQPSPPPATGSSESDLVIVKGKSCKIFIGLKCISLLPLLPRLALLLSVREI